MASLEVFSPKGTLHPSCEIIRWGGTLPRQGICPSGWHVPSDAEWAIMTAYIGGNPFAGTKLKAASDWGESGNGADTYGFRVLPAGERSYLGGLFRYVNLYADIWSASESTANSASYQDFSANPDMSVGSGTKAYSFSLRCLQN
jgi:uncharacterized protein (TIGR02145 family)